MKKIQIGSTLQMRYNIKILIAILSIFLTTTLIQAFFTWRSINNELQNRRRMEANVENDKIRALKQSVQTIVDNSVSVFEQNIDDKQKVQQLLLAMVRNNPDLLGAAVAYDPDHSPEPGGRYAPYAYRKDGKFQLLSLSYDYTTFEWFQSAFLKGKRDWCDPYADLDGTYLLMQTYSVPLKDKNKRTVAVLTGDLPMKMITYVSNIYDEVSTRSIIILGMQVFGILLILIIGWRAIIDMRKIAAQQREQEKLTYDLKLASMIQQEIQPKLLPHHDHLLMAASLHPAAEVGGDFYDYVIQDDRLYFCLGDVATRGLGATMAMLVTRTVYRTAIRQQHLPSKVVELMNEALLSINERQMYATLFVGEIDLTSGIFNYCNAGHQTPYLFSGGKLSTLEMSSNVPLGICEWQFEEQHTLLQKGDTLFFYTDGIIEAMNESEGVFGEKKLMLHLKNAAELGDHPDALIKRITTALRHHMGVEGVPNDDQAMLAISYQ